MNKLIVVRGAGDLASGIITKLYKCGFKVLALEAETPTAVRRFVSFSEAIWNKQVEVEGVTAIYAETELEIRQALGQDQVVVSIDPSGKLIQRLKPQVVIDAIIAKKNIITQVSMAPVVIGVGPGHVVGVHCHAAVESSRGHNLGRVYYQGTPEADTGIPGNVGGYTTERVSYATKDGFIQVKKDITQVVEVGDVIAKIGETEVLAHISGIVRGMLRHGSKVKKGLKIADIDPRTDQIDNCYQISDKARCIAGGVLEAVITLERAVS